MAAVCPQPFFDGLACKMVDMRVEWEPGKWHKTGTDDNQTACWPCVERPISFVTPWIGSPGKTTVIRRSMMGLVSRIWCAEGIGGVVSRAATR